MSYNPLLPSGQATMANSAPVVIASNQSAIPVTGTFYQATQPVSLASLPSLAAGSNAIGSITNTTFASTQSGTWNVGLNAGTNAIGSITNTSFGISGTLPAFASTPTVNIGTIGTIATESTLSTLNSKIPSLGQALAAGSVPVVLTASQLSTLTPLSTVSINALPTGTNSIGNIGTVSTVTNLSQLGGVAVSMGTGVRDAGTQRVTIATNDSVPVTGTFWQATQPVSGTVAATQSGTWNVGTLTSITNAVTVSQSTATSLKTQAENYQGGSAVSSSNPLYVAPLPVTSGGVTPVTGGSTGGAGSITISASAGQVYGWYFYNANTVAAYIHFYDTGSAITVGTTTAAYVLVVPPTGGANVFGIGIPHSNSIKIGISQGRAVSTAMSSAVDYNIFYK